MTVSTHILDSTAGRPASGVPVRLDLAGQTVASGHTDADGRFGGMPTPETGVYRLTFDIGTFDIGSGFYPEVTISFRVTDSQAHHHVPLLLSPFAYTTYRGS